MTYNMIPKEYDMPDFLPVNVQDGSGNDRQIVYIRLDKIINLSFSLENLLEYHRESDAEKRKL